MRKRIITPILFSTLLLSGCMFSTPKKGKTSSTEPTTSDPVVTTSDSTIEPTSEPTTQPTSASDPTSDPTSLIPTSQSTSDPTSQSTSDPTSQSTSSPTSASQPSSSSTSSSSSSSSSSSTSSAVVPTVTSVVVTPSTGNVKQGETLQLSAKVNGTNNPSQSVTWKTSNSSYATVSSSGLVSVKSTAPADAKVTITATSVADTTKSGTSTITVKSSASTKARYTLFMYVCGSSLEYDSQYHQLVGAASKDLREVLSVSGQPDDVNIVVQTGGSSQWASSPGINGSYVQRYHVSNKSLVFDENVGSSSSISMGESSTLKNFLTWGVGKYPADNYAIIFWNHGGAVSGVCFDDIHSNDGLLAGEIASAVTSAGVHFEWIGYDACIMNYIDAASLNADYANYMVGSQELENGDGWDYTGWISTLYDSSASTLTLLDKICESFIDFYDTDPDYRGYDNNQTLSVLDLSKMADFTTAFKNYTAKLSSSNFNTLKGNNCYNNSAVLKFGDVSNYMTGEYAYGVADFVSFMNKAATAVSSVSTTEVMAAFEGLVVANHYGSYYTSKKPCGTNIFIAGDSDGYVSKEEYSTSDTKFSEWRTLNINNGSWYSGGWW